MKNRTSLISEIKGPNFKFEVGEVEMWKTERTASTSIGGKVGCMADLYGGFQVNGIFVDRFHTENIADMGGVKMELRAEWSAQTQGQELDKNTLRLFFLTYGQLWCEKERNESSCFMILRDMHASKKFRVNGVTLT